MLVNLTRCMRYWDDLSVTQMLLRRMGHLEKGRLAEQSVLASNSSLKTAPNMSVYRMDSLFQEQLVFREVTTVGHSNLKTYWTDYRERC